MAARFIPSDYSGGRIVLRSGSVDVGAVFPPAVHGAPVRWIFWFGTRAVREGTAKTELAAKNALLAAWRDALARMELMEIANAD